MTTAATGQTYGRWRQFASEKTFRDEYDEMQLMCRGDYMLLKSILVVMFVWFGNFAEAQTLPVRDATRGELLYMTHCSTCHSTEVHWRDQKRVTDSASLRAEVRRWQKFSGLGWSDDDVAEVAAYLNALYYHFPTLNWSGGRRIARLAQLRARMGYRTVERAAKLSL